MPAAGGVVPTLSQVRDWDTEHLTEAAVFWTKTAGVWEDRFTELATRISAPGGIPWEGEAAEAAQQLAYSDKMTVIGLADQLHSASKIARSGARELDEARRGILRVVNAAEEAGFTVGEDFSVSDPNYYDVATAAARQEQAETLAADLRVSVGTLMLADADIADKLTTATAGLGANVFRESGDNTGQNPPVQEVDYRGITGDRDRGPDGADGQRERNDETWRRPEGGRDREGKIGWLESDWAGRAILERYLYGGGEEWDIDNDPSWSEYMKGDGELARNIDSHVLRQAQQSLIDYQQGKGSIQGFDQRFHAEMENGEAISGRQYLHGTNNDVGDFQFGGTTQVEALPDGNYRVTMQGRYTWNDIIDPNFDYQTDQMKEQWARIISLGQAQPYTMRINWEAETQFVLDKNGNPIEIKGYPYK